MVMKDKHTGMTVTMETDFIYSGQTGSDVTGRP